MNHEKQLGVFNTNLLAYNSYLACNGKVFCSYSGCVVQRAVFQFGTNPANPYECERVHAFSINLN